MAELPDRLQAALTGRYTIERELGRGGMATVYLAHDCKHDRPVALKVLRPEIAAALGPERFEREIRLAARLQHPHILTLHDSGHAAGQLWFTMPYVEGESLRARLQRERQLAVADALQITREVADALSYAHSHDVVHRDIKPENILLETGHAVVCDFGIARAITAAAGEQLTESGIAVGTPAYMSPEQASAEARIDGRADIYALGCVLYEMLAGEPPFTGSSAQAVVARQMYERPRSLRVVRPAVSPALQDVVEKALAKVPADRYASAADLATALDAKQLHSTKPRVRRQWAGVAVAVALTAMAWLVVSRIRGQVTFDPARYVVLPFQHRGGAFPELVSGNLCESLVYDALDRWSDLKRVNELRVSDALARTGPPPSLEAAVAMARGLGAGLLIWGELYELGDTIRVRAALYDVTREGGVIRESAIRLPREGGDLGRRFIELADALVAGTAGTPAGSINAIGTTSLTALIANEAGDSALWSWNLDLARQKYREALAHDPAYPQANLALGQVGEWTDDAPAEWRALATTALTPRVGLSEYSRALAAGLVALGDSEYPGACRLYRELLRRDSLDFTAWFGLGECNAKDELVVPDSASPSGWRFRSSYHAAAEAYRRALTILPSAHRAFQEVISSRLFGVLYTIPTRLRLGRAAGPGGPTFGAFPGLEHDTLAFIPYLLTDLTAARPRPAPRGFSDALDHNRRILQGIARTWVSAFPKSGEAWCAQALVLELLGQLSGDADQSALGAIRRARGLGIDSLERLRFGVVEVRLLVKLESFHAARLLSDSLLEAWPRPEAAQALRLAPLAALTGRLRRLVELLRRGATSYEFAEADGRKLELPATVVEPAVTLYAYAVMGVEPDSFRAIEQRVGRAVRNWAAPDRREATLRAVLDIPAVFGYPANGLRAVHRHTRGWFLMDLQWELAHGDTGAVRGTLQAVEDSLRRTLPPGAVAMESIYQEAWLSLAIGDTARGTGLLDATLEALASQRPDLLDDAQTPAALVRAMALKADLAGRSGNSVSAHRWANNVADLWAAADGELQPVVRRVRALAGGG